MTTMEERVSRIEGGYEHLATKADIAELRGATQADIAELRGATQASIAELRGEIRGSLLAIRWTMGVMGIGLAVLTIVLKLLE
jgi:hypothetical protein